MPPVAVAPVRQIRDGHLPYGPARAAAGVDGTCVGTGTLRSCSRGQLRRRGRGTCDEGLHRRSLRQARRSSAAGHPPRSRTPPMPGRRPATSGCRRSRDPKAPDVDQCCLSGRAAAGHRHRESARARPGPRRDVHDNPKGGSEPMGITLRAFTPLEDSLWLTLCCRALDNRSPHPILGDAMADEIVRTLHYDYGQLHIDTNLIVNVSGLRRPPRTRRLEPQIEPGQGDPAQPGARGLRVSTCSSPVLPAGSAQHSLVPEGNHRPALPLLTPHAPAPTSLTS